MTVELVGLAGPTRLRGFLSDTERSLVCSVRNRICALPLRHVIETMRPLPVKAIAGAPRPVMGVAIIRGAAVPVVDLAWVLAAEESRPTRFVTVDVDGRSVALAVDAVGGVRSIPAGSRRAAKKASRSRRRIGRLPSSSTASCRASTAPP